MTTKLVAIAALALVASVSQATTYTILNTSTMNDVRKVGGANIPEIDQFGGVNCLSGTCAGSLNPLDPASWPLLDRDITTYPYADPNDPNRAVAIELNNINVYGTIDVASGSVTAAIVRQCDNIGCANTPAQSLGYATYQSSSVQNNLVSGDMSLINNDPLSGTVIKSVTSNPLVWTYNSVTGQFNHQSGGGTAATSASIATCVPVTAPGVGTGISGQCRQLAGQIDASGELGGTTINASIWNFDGLGANFIVRDSQTLPWHTGTGTGTTGGLQVSGGSGLAGVIWDLSGFVDGVGGVITARAIASASSNGGTANATAMSALYTFNLTAVPVPAAVWLFGGALGLLGFARRRSA